jgi:hypothetical protein
MAQEILVKESLEKEKFEAGKELLKRLAKTDFKVLAAFWLWIKERNEWELVIASPWVNQNGSLNAYRKIDDIFFGEPSPISDFEFTNLHVMDTTKPLIKALRTYAKEHHTNLAGKRLKDHWFGDVSIDDAYLYFVK